MYHPSNKKCLVQEIKKEWFYRANDLFLKGICFKNEINDYYVQDILGTPFQRIHNPSRNRNKINRLKKSKQTGQTFNSKQKLVSLSILQDGFNFNKIPQQQILCKLKSINPSKNQQENLIVVNFAPICPLHSLFLPFCKINNPQILTYQALEQAIGLFLEFDSQMVMGYNSIEAAASVNHLHFHLLSKKQLQCQGEQFPKINIYEPLKTILVNIDFKLSTIHNKFFQGFHLKYFDRLTSKYCFVKLVRLIFRIMNFIIDQNIPHNMIIYSQKAFSKEQKQCQMFVLVRNFESQTESGFGFLQYGGLICKEPKDNLDSIIEQTFIRNKINVNTFQMLQKQIVQIIKKEVEQA